MRKYNFLYKTTNSLNGKYYIGVHKTDNLDDGYLGSGKRLKYSIKKYGKENFTREILEFFDTYEDALLKEAELVNEDFISLIETYNLKIGGSSGWNYIHKIGSHISGGRKGGLRFKDRLVTDLEFRKQNAELVSIRSRKMHEEGRAFVPNFTDKRHKEESKIAIGKANAIKQKGERNSQFGTCWIHNLELKVSKKIKREDLDSWIQQGWIKGRKIKL